MQGTTICRDPEHDRSERLLSPLRHVNITLTMVPLQTSFPLTVQPGKDYNEILICDKAPRYLTITTELIRWRKVCFFLQNILAILADSNLGLFYFCNFSFLYLIGFSVFLVLASFLIFQRLRQNGSTEIHLKLVVNFAVSCNWDSPKQTEN